MAKKLLLLTSLIALNPLMACDNDWTLAAFFKNNAPTFVVAAIGTLGLIMVNRKYENTTSDLKDQIGKLNKELRDSKQSFNEKLNDVENALQNNARDINLVSQSLGAFIRAFGFNPTFTHNIRENTTHCDLETIPNGKFSQLVTETQMNTAIDAVKQDLRSDLNIFKKQTGFEINLLHNKQKHIRRQIYNLDNYQKSIKKCLALLAKRHNVTQNNVASLKKDHKATKNNVTRLENNLNIFANTYNTFIDREVKMVQDVYEPYLGGVKEVGAKVVNSTNAHKNVKEHGKTLSTSKVNFNK